MEEGSIERVRDLLQRYSSERMVSPDESFLSDIDTSRVSGTTTEEESMRDMIESLRSSLEMIEGLRRRRVRISGKEAEECQCVLGKIVENVKAVCGTPYNTMSTYLVVGMVSAVVCVGCSMYSRYY